MTKIESLEDFATEEQNEEEKVEEKVEFNVGDMLVANVNAITYKEAYFNIFNDNYCFERKSCFEELNGDSFYTLFEYLGDNKLMEAITKRIICIEDADICIEDAEEFSRDNLTVQEFYNKCEYNKENPLYIYRTRLIPYDINNAAINILLQSGFNSREYISEKIETKTNEIISKTDEEIKALILISQGIANVENERINLNNAVKAYNKLLVKPIDVEPKIVKYPEEE